MPRPGSPAFLAAGAGAAAATAVVTVHITAVAVVPPAAVWRCIQAIRCFRDKSFVRWPPHINLLYPFLPDGRGSYDRCGRITSGSVGPSPDAGFQQLALRAGRALSHVAPFRVRLERLRTFRHSPRSLTLWADLVVVASARDAPSGPGTKGGGGSKGGGVLLEVQRLLEAEFPGCSDLSHDESRGIHGFVPHLSLGQLRDESELEVLQASWQPLEFNVDSVQLMSRQGYLSPFTIRYHVPLGLGLNASSIEAQRDLEGGGAGGGGSGGGDVSRIDVPYIATMTCLTDGGRNLAGQAEAAGFEGRFASPCLALPLHRHGKDGCGNEQTAGGSALPAGDSAVRNSSSPSCAVAVGRSGGRQLGGEDGGGGHSGRSHVWWFAYGAALAATGPQMGAVESVAARLEGYRLAFNRRGGRANLVPEGPDEGPKAPGAAGCGEAEARSVVETHGLLGQAPRGITAQPTATTAAACMAGSAAVKGMAGGDAGEEGDDRRDADGGGSALPSPAVHGVLHRLPVNMMARLLLANSEAWPVDVQCWPYGLIYDHHGDAAAASAAAPTSEPVVAVAFQVPPERCLALEVAPTEGYVAAMGQACESYGIDPRFRSWLQRVATARDDAERGLVYDTGADGRALARQGAFRTGAKKAAAGLPRSVLDW